ncbi:MAG: LacI family DNA-binding transcriptional regulator [Kiritimatiellae bacterium]|nr:LacI family DNA-binding transcriptional regulator [Kiritimatiellia bacterium]
MSTPKVSIHDVAREAGVSAATVSRVLNRGSVSDETRGKVLHSISKLGFIPDARASNLKSRRQSSIGLIATDITNPIVPVGVQAIHDFVQDRGYSLQLGISNGRPARELQIMKRMAEGRVAGLILGWSEGETDAACLQYLCEIVRNGIPIVLQGRNTGGVEADQVSVDNAKGVRAAASYLLRTGRGKVAFVAGPRGQFATETRFAGYRDALAAKQAPLREERIVFGDWSRENGRKAMARLLALADPPDGVVCGNDLIAVGAIETLEEQGRAVPRDVAVVGFDDIELASLVRPRLTTVAQPQRRISELTARLLIDRIEGRVSGEPREILIEPDLIVRESA